MSGTSVTVFSNNSDYIACYNYAKEKENDSIGTGQFDKTYSFEKSNGGIAGECIGGENNFYYCMNIGVISFYGENDGADENTNTGCQIYLEIQQTSALAQLGKHENAVGHLKEALSMSGTDRIYMPFAEHCDYITPILEELENYEESEGSDTFAGEIQDIMSIISTYRKSKREIQRDTFKMENVFGFNDLELEIVKLVCDKLSNKEIASQIHLSESRVKMILRDIYAKADIKEGKDKRKVLAEIV